MTAGLALVFSGCALITPPGEEPTPEPPAPGWSVGADLFDPLQEQSVVAWQAEVVIIGGFDGVAAVVDRVEAYDPLSDSWRLLPDLPVPLHHALAVVHDGSLFVLGGNTNGNRALDSLRQRLGVRFDFLPSDRSKGRSRGAMRAIRQRAAGARGVIVVTDRCTHAKRDAAVETCRKQSIPFREVKTLSLSHVAPAVGELLAA